MDKYQVSWQVSWIEERLYTHEVQADSEDEAWEILSSGDLDWPEPYYVQIDYVEAEKLNG